MADGEGRQRSDAPAAQPAEQPPAQTRPAPGNALARQESRRDVIVPLDVEATKGAMSVYQEGLHALLSPADWQGPPGQDGSFVKKSGWRKIAAWFSLDLELIAEQVEYAASDDEHARAKKGDPLRAKVVMRAVAPNGRYADGDGRCSINEGRFAQDKGRQKLDNDLPGTATTRAANRAISNLVGLGAVSGEEVGEQDAPAAGPPFGDPASEDLAKTTAAAIAYLLDTGSGPDAELAKVVLGKVHDDAGGYLPKIVGRAFAWAAKSLKDTIDGRSAEAGTTPAAEESQAPAESEADVARDAQAEEEPETVSGEVVNPPSEEQP